VPLGRLSQANSVGLERGLELIAAGEFILAVIRRPHLWGSSARHLHACGN